ncbi:MAG: 4-hydroxy-tetrahydrodipicolinate reductase [Peptococcaceae bacterium]|jgi:4-hydroxy-tetrahydrodipicolinate reductase|nr:4-hydroxy-tetrahydrodipicolinate reductase [Peptococcaceae bacterium]
MIRVVVTGAYGKMGREVVKTVLRTEDMELVGAVDSAGEGTDVGTLVEAGNTGVVIEKDLAEVLARVRPDVAVDFTNPHCVFSNALIYLQHGVRPVIGTTGLSPEQIDEIIETSSKHKVGGLIAPNVAIGALLMMKFAAEASRYLPSVEIIELHHDQKLDAPSGTAIKTAEGIMEQRDPEFRQGLAAEIEKVPGARGGAFDGGIRIHSVRLPGLVAHQEVIFGGLGETLTIRHDSITRESFMPGVLVGVRKVMHLERVVYGLDRLLFE